jgi:hypothetical protein
MFLKLNDIGFPKNDDSTQRDKDYGENEAMNPHSEATLWFEICFIDSDLITNVHLKPMVIFYLLSFFLSVVLEI